MHFVLASTGWHSLTARRAGLRRAANPPSLLAPFGGPSFCWGGCPGQPGQPRPIPSIGPFPYTRGVDSSFSADFLIFKSPSLLSLINNAPNENEDDARPPNAPRCTPCCSPPAHRRVDSRHRSTHCRRLASRRGPRHSAMMKEHLDSDRLNYLVWR